MEIPINVPIPWAKQEQADRRNKNRGRYSELVRDCPAARQLDRLVNKYVDRVWVVVCLLLELWLLLVVSCCVVADVDLFFVLF